MKTMSRLERISHLYRNFPDGLLFDAFRLLLVENFIYSTSAVVSRQTYEKIRWFHR